MRVPTVVDCSWSDDGWLCLTLFARGANCARRGDILGHPWSREIGMPPPSAIHEG